MEPQGSLESFYGMLFDLSQEKYSSEIRTYILLLLLAILFTQLSRRASLKPLGFKHDWKPTIACLLYVYTDYNFWLSKSRPLSVEIW